MSNILFTVTGPSGSGKTTIFRSILNNELLSFTTRPMREGEVNGVDYLFISKEEFDELYEDGVLAEWTEYDGRYYGLTMEEINDKLSHGHAFFVCDNHGYHQVVDKYDNIVSIFLYADKEDCEDNMLDRGDEEGRVKGRLSTYHSEVANRGEYDYVIKNIRGHQEMTREIVAEIVASEIAKADREAMNQ
jgi:guanylate kinase